MQNNPFQIGRTALNLNVMPVLKKSECSGFTWNLKSVHKFILFIMNEVIYFITILLIGLFVILNHYPTNYQKDSFINPRS
jgi:hypothetical protein